MNGLSIVCTGQPIDAQGQPIGDPCGRRAPERDHLDPGPYLESLRIAGWRIGPAGDAMCPRCARPSPELLRLLRELTP